MKPGNMFRGIGHFYTTALTALTTFAACFSFNVIVFEVIACKMIVEVTRSTFSGATAGILRLAKLSMPQAKPLIAFDDLAYSMQRMIVLGAPNAEYFGLLRCRPQLCNMLRGWTLDEVVLDFDARETYFGPGFGEDTRRQFGLIVGRSDLITDADAETIKYGRFCGISRFAFVGSWIYVQSDVEYWTRVLNSLPTDFTVDSLFVDVNIGDIREIVPLFGAVTVTQRLIATFDATPAKVQFQPTLVEILALIDGIPSVDCIITGLRENNAITAEIALWAESQQRNRNSLSAARFRIFQISGGWFEYVYDSASQTVSGQQVDDVVTFDLEDWMFLQ